MFFFYQFKYIGVLTFTVGISGKLGHVRLYIVLGNFLLLVRKPIVLRLVQWSKDFHRPLRGDNFPLFVLTPRLCWLHKVHQSAFLLCKQKISCFENELGLIPSPHTPPCSKVQLRNYVIYLNMRPIGVWHL